MPKSLRCELVTSAETMQTVVNLQEAIWGGEIVVPRSQLIAAVKCGGVVIVACEGEKPVGFCYGLAGFDGKVPYMWSHMLGVLPDYRDGGIGFALKLAQRRWALEYGYRRISWTFDPLESRNAYFNLCKLGCTIRSYGENYYGPMNDNINRGMPTDRFIADWQLDAERVRQAVDGRGLGREHWSRYAPLGGYKLYGNLPVPDEGEANGPMPGLGAEGYLIPVPAQMERIKEHGHGPELVKTWRNYHRRLFRELFRQGYAAVGFMHATGPVHYYVVEKEGLSA